ncbi:MAG TPA: response regulator [Thermodesulfobacteriota bacterium]|nr:response regulator [Thermodesulfobacteriota bacterium]
MTTKTASILVVEDDPIQRLLLTTCLNQEGYTVRTAEDGKEALGRLDQENFDLILLDLLLPEMDGFEVLERIKTRPGLQHLPVIVVSAEEDMKSIARCIEMGASDYISKPCEPALLRTRVNASLAMKRLYDRETYTGTILVVEDDPLNRMILSAHLAEEAYTVKTAENGRVGLQMLREQPFDIVLLDLLMPEMDGFDVLKVMKADARLRHLPVIVISGEGDLASITRCISTGAEDYVQKPFDPVLLRTRVSACVEKKRLRDQEIRQQQELNELNKALEVRNRFIRRTFGRYLSDEVVDTILDSPRGLVLGGEKRNVSILLSDLRGFTSLGELLPAESVVRIVNLYLDAMTPIIGGYGGTIDQFIGDAIIAMFGAPISHEDDHLRAVACAVDMQLAMRGVNARCRAEGLPEVSMGIGINTGEVVVGNIGSTKRTKYGPMGRNVNLASRIESYTVGGQILISESTLRACGTKIETTRAMEVMPKGFRDPIMLYEVKGIGGGFNRYISPKKPAEAITLSRPIPIVFWKIEGKHVDRDLHKALITGVGGETLDIRSASQVNLFTDLRIALLDENGNPVEADIYAKVTEILPEGPNAFRVHFSHISAEAARFLETRLGCPSACEKKP